MTRSGREILCLVAMTLAAYVLVFWGLFTPLSPYEEQPEIECVSEPHSTPEACRLLSFAEYIHSCRGVTNGSPHGSWESESVLCQMWQFLTWEHDYTLNRERLCVVLLLAFIASFGFCPLPWRRDKLTLLQWPSFWFSLDSPMILCPIVVLLLTVAIHLLLCAVTHYNPVHIPFTLVCAQVSVPLFRSTLLPVFCSAGMLDDTLTQTFLSLWAERERAVRVFSIARVCVALLAWATFFHGGGWCKDRLCRFSLCRGEITSRPPSL